MNHEDFISNIAIHVQKYAPKFGIAVCSPIIAQTILESGWGTSKKAQHNNYFGLKYREGRVDCNNGYITDGGTEQELDGSYSELPSDTAWYAFDNMEMGVKGYFQFTNISNYRNLKGVTDPHEYLENVKSDGYATSHDYVDNVYRIITENNLTKYDNVAGEKSDTGNEVNMKIGLISGHGAGDCGALGCGFAEADLTIEVVKLLNERLNSAGIETVVYPYENNAYQDGKHGGLVVDFSDCTYVLEVHFNACVQDESGNGRVTGTEIWVTPREAGITVENLILDKMAELGFTNRGVKVEDFLVINLVKNTGVSSALIETCFIDDRDDMNLFTNNKSAVVDAIARGIIEGFGGSLSGEEVTAEPAPSTPTPSRKSEDEIADEIFRGVGGWGNGQDRKDRLAAAGYDYNSIQAKVNVLCGQISTPTPSRKSEDEIADEIFRGVGGWGNGQDRKDKLTAAGYDAKSVQSKVNAKF